MTLQLVCGAECGIVTKSATPALTRHWDVNGSPTIDTTTYRSGVKSFAFAAAATAPYLIAELPATQTVGYFLGYFRLTDATPSTAITLVRASGVGYNEEIMVSTGGVLQATFNGGTATQNGPTLIDNTWYAVEAEFDMSANPGVIRWRTWSTATGWVAQTNASNAVAATNFAKIFFGIITGPTSGVTVNFDDIVVGSGTVVGGDYSTTTSKGGCVLRYQPNADGVHSFTTNDFKYNNSTGFASTATDVWTYLDETDQTESAGDYISQAVARAGSYIRLAFANEAVWTNLRGLMVLTVMNSNAGGADEAHLRISDDGSTWTNIWGDWANAGLDVAYNGTFADFRGAVLTTKPSGGAWTQAALNSTDAEWGNSDDVVPPPFLHNVSFEVAWTGDTNPPYDPFGMTGFFGA